MKILKKFKYVILLTLLLLLTFISAYSYSNAISKDLADNVFRLHVIANSDSNNDQELKLKVRDALLEYVTNLTKEDKYIGIKKEELINILGQSKNELQEIANNVIKENGYNYPIEINIGNYSFPTKAYGDISLPSGYYDALRVEIGKAEGQNWWCVMFPPLCFVDVSSGILPEESKTILEENLSSEEFSVVSTTQIDDVTFKFKIVEFFQNAKISTAKNK